MTIKLRPHHLFQLYLLPDEYEKERIEEHDAKFNENFVKVISSILENPDQEIEIVDTMDDLCVACPYLSDRDCTYPGCERTEQQLILFEKREADMFHINVGDVFTTNQLLEQVRHRLFISLRLEDYFKKRKKISIRDYMYG